MDFQLIPKSYLIGKIQMSSLVRPVKLVGCPVQGPGDHKHAVIGTLSS